MKKMLPQLSAVRNCVKIQDFKVSIDNLVFKLHYRFTTLFLVLCVILVSSREYIGEHIRCLVDNGVPQNVINTFCFFTTTFTVIKHQNSTMVEQGHIPHPGVGPSVESDEIKHHAYYQWVPFVLTLQAVMFYIPHYIWKKSEGGRLKALVSGLKIVSMAHQDEDIVVNGVVVPSKNSLKGRLHDIQRDFLHRLYATRPWSTWLVGCELLNLLNIIFQIYVTDAFLGGRFMTLGIHVMTTNWDDAVDILDIVFPKMTKCFFYKYGPSGSIQTFDSLCVMALNVIHEKIYTFLWFWFFFLLFMSILGMLWRIVTFIMHSRSARFSEYVFSTANPQHLKIKNVIVVTKRCHFADWLFLYYLAKNMDGFIFKNLFLNLAEELSPIPSTSSEVKNPMYYPPPDPNPNDEEKSPILDDVDATMTEPTPIPTKEKSLDVKFKDV